MRPHGKSLSPLHQRCTEGAVMRNKNLLLWITIITSDVLMGTVKVRMYSGIVGSLHLFESTINADWSTQDFYTLPSRCCLF